MWYDYIFRLFESCFKRKNKSEVHKNDNANTNANNLQTNIYLRQKTNSDNYIMERNIQTLIKLQQIQNEALHELQEIHELKLKCK